jgi:AcrR family transcriptional regulator
MNTLKDINIKQKVKELNKQGITLKAIAIKAQINPGSLYKYFENAQNLNEERKNKLFKAVEQFTDLMNEQ